MQQQQKKKKKRKKGYSTNRSVYEGPVGGGNVTRVMKNTSHQQTKNDFLKDLYVIFNRNA